MCHIFPLTAFYHRFQGYKATFEKDRMWRKTRQPFGLCRGTDLNRNWNSAWNKTG